MNNGQIDTSYVLLAIFALGALFLLLVFAGLVILLVRVGLKRKENHKKRSVELRAVADRLGFEFTEASELSSLPFLADFEIFEGSPSRIENLMTGSRGGERIGVFDLAYVNTGPNGGSTTSRQTMCVIESTGLNLPRFYVRPEGILEKALQFAGRNDIDFPEFPTFSNAFYLYGDDEAAIRAIIKPEFARFFEQNSVLSAYAAGPRLIVFRSRYPARPQEFEGYVMMAKALKGLV